MGMWREEGEDENLDVVDHGENGVLVEGWREAVGREDGEADALERAREALARVDGTLLEADQHPLAAQLLLRVLEELHELLARERRHGGLLGRDEEGERRLLRHVAHPSGGNIFN